MNDEIVPQKQQKTHRELNEQQIIILIAIDAIILYTKGSYTASSGLLTLVVRLPKHIRKMSCANITHTTHTAHTRRTQHTNNETAASTWKAREAQIQADKVLLQYNTTIKRKSPLQHWGLLRCYRAIAAFEYCCAAAIYNTIYYFWNKKQHINQPGTAHETITTGAENQKLICCHTRLSYFTKYSNSNSKSNILTTSSINNPIHWLTTIRYTAVLVYYCRHQPPSCPASPIHNLHT